MGCFGCLFAILDIICDLILDSICELMCLILPENKLKESTRFILESFITVFTYFLFIVIIISALILIFGDVSPSINKKLKLTIIIPLGIIVVQSTLGIIFRIKSKKRNQ